jgi:hypothetical protein
MKYLIVLTLDLPGPEHMARAVEKIDPPKIPGFVRPLRITVDPHATNIEEWLDE